MIASVLTKTNKPLTQKEVEDYIIAVFQGCYNIPVAIYGFMYKPDVGIYTFGPREELQKLNNTNIEDFVLEDYINEPNSFWLVDWKDPTNPKLNRLVK